MAKELLMTTAEGKFIVRQLDESGRELQIVRKLTEAEERMLEEQGPGTTERRRRKPRRGAEGGL